ncbi:MAG: SPFH domain-containing protein [Patescibacteria group bacterium]
MYRQSMSSTNSVQSFIRGLAFTVAFLVLGLITLVLSGISTTLFGSATILVLPSLLFNVWLSSILSGMFYILPEYENMVLLKLGKFDSVKGAGFFIIPPFIYSIASIIDSRIETKEVQATATLTKDNVPTKVTAAIEFQVEDAKKAVLAVQNYRLSVEWLATEALKNTIGSLDLKDLLSEREQIAVSLKNQIDEEASKYGVDVRAVRITDIDTPQTLVEELAVIARARRASEAKQIQADAEINVAKKIAEASQILNSTPAGMKLRELQTLAELGKEESSMIIIYPYGDTTGKDIASATAGANK